jgi:hypothetical protein
LRAETENNAIAGIIMDTNIDLFGNSKGENDEVVKRIRMPAIIAASVLNNILPLICSLVSDGIIQERYNFICRYPGKKFSYFV